MLYCFVEEDLTGLPDGDPWTIQAEYAKRLGAYCRCNLAEGTVADQTGRPVRVTQERVFLRATCAAASRAARLLEAGGADLLETPEDIRTIEHWERLPVAERLILPVSFRDIFEASYSLQTKAFLESAPRVFAKSREKGFCVRFPSERLLRRDAGILGFLKARCSDPCGELLFSQEFTVKTDSLGRCESRHVVMNGAIANSSRPLQSLKHTVPRSHREKADELVRIIAAQRGFPRNYALDVGAFEKDGETVLDIVEINPVSCSLCYVNNSIFHTVVPEAALVRQKTGMGAEYCYDAVKNPVRYQKNRFSGASYEYRSDEHYYFA